MLISFILAMKSSHARRGLKHFFRKKNSEHPIIEAQRETPKLLNNSKNNLFNLKITVLLDLARSKMGSINLLHFLPQL